MHLFMFSTPHLPMFMVYCSSHQCVLHLSLRTCTVAVYNFCQQIYYVQQCRCFFCISCGTWLVSIGSNGMSMISDSLGFGLGVCVCVCVCVCVAVWCSGLCSRFPIETLRVRSPPSTVSHVFLLLLYLWVVTNSQMCMSEYMWWEKKKKKKKKKKGIVTGQNQPLRAVWCNTRLLNSGGQFDQTCNLFGGAIPAQGLC